MIPYFDTGFLATPILNATGSPIAWRLARLFEAPYPVNRLHVLQIEGMLFKAAASNELPEQQAALTGVRLWNRHFEEGVFEPREEAWEVALRLATNTNRQTEANPVSPLFHLHMAVALLANVTHFLSFRAQARALAAALGLKLLPERL
ncbi:MAG: hypothetical protein HYY24_10380 [Verrucomicrobia bacterium]|nr:hypothetical protein [Verrucomicrobiota bacterium]